MKIRLFLALCVAGCLSAQNKMDKEQKNLSELEVKFLYSTTKDTTDLANRMEEMMILDLNSSSSLYYSDAFLQRRKSIETELMIAKNSGGMAKIDAGKIAKPKVDYSVYRANGKNFVTSRLGTDLFTFEGESPKWEANFKDEKIILGYRCKKATTTFNKRQYIAWYTKEIPISEGPYRFKGLPGLVMEVEDIKGYDTFKTIGIEKKQVEIAQLQNGIPVSREEYLRKREEFKSNPYPSKIMDKSKRNQLADAIKKFNNSLER
ncbi:GLPGLI family protein [Chryseobacterium sp. Marseille-Q8038]